MNKDSAFIRGQSHIVCQDYAMSGMIQNLSWAIVADGCSMIRTSNESVNHPYSDFSARIVAFSAKEAIYELQQHGDATGLLRSDFITLLRSKVRTIGDLVGITEIAGDATLNIACHHDSIIMHMMIGDGVVVVDTERELIIRERKFVPNFPYYVSYILLPNRAKHYNSLGVKASEHTYIIDKKTGGIRESEEEKSPDLTESVEIYNTKETKSITVFSDGIGDLRKGQQLSVIQAVQKMLPFKSYGGTFVKRRMRGFERTLAKECIVANDDIAMATIVT